MTELLATPAGFTLRRWADDDADAVLAAFAPPDMAWQAGPPISDRAGAVRWLRGCLRDWDRGTGYWWAVTDQRDVVLGNVAVTSVDRRHDTGWVSYWTTETARGHGVASAGTRALARWALGELGLFRLELGHRTNNPASCRVALQAGFVAEGLERAKLRYGSTRYDVELHARLATDPEQEPGRGWTAR